ncbi:MAG: tetratricopeptide repeat protein [Pirellulales bacterium]|nr:tetratricopeptide repeat protein [Pirellulales bacterium]
MRTFNVRFAVILLVVTIVVGGGVYWLNSVQVKANAGFFLEQAGEAEKRVEAAKKKNDPKMEREAIRDQLINFQWYLRFMPDELDVMEQYALLQAKYIDSPTTFNQAYWALEELLRKDPAREAPREKLIELSMIAKRFSDAESHLKYFLQKHPDNPKFLDLFGQCQWARHQERKAEEYFRKALELNPKQVDTYWLLTRLLLTMNRLEEANAVVQQMVKFNPDDIQARLNQVQYLLATRKTDEARLNVEKALELSPDDEKAIYLATMCALRSENLEQARKYAQRGVELFPKKVSFYTTLADIEARSGHRDQALQVLDQGLGAIPKSPELIWMKAYYLVDEGDYEAAKKTVSELKQLPGYKNRSEFIEARIHFGKMQWREAAQCFEKSRDALSGNRELLKRLYFWLGVCYGQLRNLDKQIDAFNRATEIDPFFELAQKAKIQALQSSGQLKAAEREINKLTKFVKDQDQILLPQIRIKVLEILRQPKSQRNWEEVESLLNEAAKKTPDSSTILQYRCEMLADKGKFEEAEKLLREWLEKKPKDPLLWELRLGLALRMRDWGKAEELLLLWENENGDSAALRLAKCRLYLNQYGNQAGPRLWKLEEKIESFNDQEKRALYDGLLGAAHLLGDQENLSRLAGLIAELDPQNIQIHFLQMDRAYQRADQTAMKTSMENLKKIEGEGPLWHYGQALLLELRYREKKDVKLLEQALDNLTQAQKMRKSWSKIPLLRGAIYDQLQNEKLGLQNYLEAINGGEYNSVAIRRSLQIFFAQQRYTEAEDLLQTLEREQAPITPEIFRMWAELLLQQGDFNLAVKKAQQAVAADSKDYRELLWRGQILSVAAANASNEGRKQEALALSQEVEKSFRRAVELKDTEPALWVALILFLSKQGKTVDAENALEQARQKLTGPSADLALAPCYGALDQNDKEKDLYQAALAAKPDDLGVLRRVTEFYLKSDQPKEAEPLLQRVLQGKVKAEKQDVCWARRNMAALEASRGDYASLKKARKMIEENLADFPNSTPDRRSLAFIDLYDPDPGVREQGMKLIQTMIEEKKASTDDLFQLARQYLSRGDWKNASDMFLKLLTMAGNDSRYLGTYIRALLDHDEVANAGFYLKTLKKLAPLDYRTTQLEAEILFRRGKEEEAFQLLQGFVDRANARPADRSLRIYYMADTMEKLAQRIQGTDRQATAEEYLRTADIYYRQYVDDHPSQKTVLADFLSRQGRREDAVQVLESSWKNCAPASLAQSCINVAEEGKGDPKIIQRADHLLREARDKFSSHPTILVALGAISSGQGRFADAEGFYREVLKKYPGSPVAMNNLAMLLSVTRKNLDEALQLINKAIEISGPVPPMCDTRACVYLARHEPQKALAETKIALAGEVTAERLFHQALVYEQLGQNHAAAAAMAKALEQGLTSKKVLRPELPAFERLEKAAQALSPPKKQ